MNKTQFTTCFVALGVLALSPVPLMLAEKLARIDKKGLER